MPQYNIPTTDILSCIGDSVELNFNSITFPDDLQWYDPNGNPLGLGSTVTAKDIGYYVLEFGYSNGCTFTDSVQVFSQVSTLEYVLGESPLINCENPEGEITALINSPYDEISWYHNGYLGNSQVLTVDEAGLYIIEISDINNCITRDSVYVESDFSLAPYTLESVDIDCFAGKGTLSVNSDSTIQVTWTHPSGQVVTSESFETTQAGTYYIEILNSNGCSELDSIELEANQDFPVISSAFDSLTCVKNTSTITVESNISNTQFEWTGPAGFNSTSDSLTVQQNGQYIYTATTENGCSVTDTITIYLDDEKPNFSLSADTINCFSPTATVLVQTTGDYTIAEVVSPDLIAIDNLAIEIGQAGLTTVIVIGDNGCETSESIQVIADLTKPESPIQEDIILNCFQTDTTLWIDVSDENDIFWIIGQQYVNFDDSFYIDSPGNIMIELQDKESGCTSSTEFNVDLDFSVPQMSLQASDINCQDTISTIYLSTQDNIYSLDFSSELNQINQTEFTTKASGTYSFVLQGDNGCTAEQSIIVSEDKIKPIIATIDQYLNCHNDPLNLSCSYDISNPEFIWVDPKGNETNNAILSTTSSGSYYITVTNPDNHCFETASLEVIPYKNNLAFEYTIEEALCYGETAILTDINIIAGNDPYELIVYNEFGQIANQNALGEGDYTLVFVDLDGCDSTTYFSIEEPVKIELDLDKELTLGIGTDLAIEAYTNLDPSEIEEINWTPDNY